MASLACKYPSEKGGAQAKAGQSIDKVVPDGDQGFFESQTNAFDSYRPDKLGPFNFLEPTKTYRMPDVLREISGLAVVGDSMAYCIQDERGIVFSYDLKTREITDTYRFAEDGDFEDIAVSERLIAVLRSEGTVFFWDRQGDRAKVQKKTFSLNCLDLEGLFLSGDGNEVIISCKEPLITGPKDERVVYKADLEEEESLQKALVIYVGQLQERLKNNYSQLARDNFEFNPSAVATDPISGHQWVLSARNSMIAEFGEGRLLAVYPLPKNLYNKPEGLDFSREGNLYLSSEGEKGEPQSGRIYFFERRVERGSGG
jgi:hypothetical protein